MNSTSNIIGVKALHGGVMSLEQRIEILEELLLVKPPTEMPSPAVIEPALKTDKAIEEIDKRLETMGSDLGDLKSNIEDLDSELCDAKIILDDLEETGISGEQLTDRIKHYLRTYLRNALGLEVSFDDKRQA
jgi:hypothetical protein